MPARDITLSVDDIAHCVRAADASSVKLPQTPFMADQREERILIAAAEMAVARALGIERFEPSLRGIGQFLRVRIRRRHEWELIVSPDTPNSFALVHCTGTVSKIRIHGWIRARDAKRPDWLAEWGDQKATIYAPPTDALHDLATLDSSDYL